MGVLKSENSGFTRSSCKQLSMDLCFTEENHPKHLLFFLHERSWFVSVPLTCFIGKSAL